MSILLRLLEAQTLVPPLAEHEADSVSAELAAISGLAVYPRSVVAKEGCVCFLGRQGLDKRLGILTRGDCPEFAGETRQVNDCRLKICPADHANAGALRRALPHTAPVVVGTRLSFGAGDRLGLATPGHIRAFRGAKAFPVLCQQSIREMTRTQRSPEQVMDCATWGVFEEGWQTGFGADADHLKTAADIDRTLAVGFCMFTIDPGDHVDNAANSDSLKTLKAKFARLPWETLQSSEAEYPKLFLGKRFKIGFDEMTFSEETFLRAAAKYAAAIAHTVGLYRHLVEKSGAKPFELEMSVDETDTPTSVAEHLYIAHELKRLGVKVVSLAPRFIGDFEKGIDYKGDLAEFEKAFAKHVAIAKQFGPYKISIHSGSDKFKTYPIAARLSGGLVHVKTAGTSYLEALRAIGQIDPQLFREIYQFCRDRYDTDRATYHVSATLKTVPKPLDLKDSQLGGLLDRDDCRQVFHVTFGSVLTTQCPDGSCCFRDRILLALRSHEEVHYETVAKHIRRHIEPFNR